MLREDRRRRRDRAARGRVLAALLRLKQVCNHPASFIGEGDRPPLGGRSGKLARLEEMLEEVIEEGEAALVFTQFAEFGHRLREYLQGRLGREVLFLHGGTPSPRRDEMVTRFQRPDGPPVFVLSLKAGRHRAESDRAPPTSSTSTAGGTRPSRTRRPTGRSGSGRRRNVQVHKYVCAGTLEEKIDALIERSRRWPSRSSAPASLADRADERRAARTADATLRSGA